MKKSYSKIISFIFITLFVLGFSYLNGGDYKEHYELIKKQELSKYDVKIKSQNFSLENIKEIKNINFYYTPYKNILDKLVGKINNANHKIYLEVYMLTETRIQNAIAKAKNRGLDVKVVLEKNPYKSPGLNKKAYNFLTSKGVDVAYSNSKSFSLNHSKMILIDDEIFLSTGNFTYSSFAYNREFMLFIKDKNLYEKLNELFLGDYNGILTYVYHDNLIISPDYSRIKIEKSINEAKNSIQMYFPYLSDKGLKNLLIKKAKLNIDIQLILGSDSSNDKKDIDEFKRNNIKIKLIKKPKIHAKSILIDGKYLYIGSINFSRYSLDKNREIGLIFKNKEVINKFLNIFRIDFEK